MQGVLSFPSSLAAMSAHLTRTLRAIDPVSIAGSISAVCPAHLAAAGLSRHVSIGDRVRIGGERPVIAEIIRIEADTVLAKPFGNADAVALGQAATRIGALRLAPHEGWKGRIVNALGDPLDAGGPLGTGPRAMPVDAPPPAALQRARVASPVVMGVRVIDLFTPLCAGQRIGVFAGSGVGKSTLLAMLAKARGFDAVVVALIGERGREVREFLEDTLGKDRGKAVIVVATGDESPMMRRLAPRTAMSIAEYFRDAGQSVLLILDSITRFAQAAREVALAAGEAPVARGFPPSVFSDLPRLLERAGPGETGSITAVISELVDGDDHNDPIADAVRGTLDGHIVLERAIADQGRFPAVDILRSISRLALRVWTAEQKTLIAKLRAMAARHEETRDLRLLGGYQAGSDGELDQAIAMTPRLYAALNQSPADHPSQDAFRELADLLSVKA